MKKIVSWLIRNVPRRHLQRVSGAGLKILGLLYRGNTVMCPVCGKGFRKFLPYGRIKPRENALCPNCMSLERHRLLWLYLKDRTHFFSHNLKVLHIAPEACFIKQFGKIHGRDYITADIESPLAKVKMDIHQIPFEMNMFDVVLCNHVLEHVKDDIRAMSEIHRVLKPGGLAILQVPFFNPIPDATFEDPTITNKSEREQLFGQDDHVRRYGRDYSERIKRSGLEPFEDAYVNEIEKAAREKYGLVKGEVIFGGRKGETV